MGTTVYFEERIKSKIESEGEVDLSFGKTTFCKGEPLMYLTIFGKQFVVDEQTGRRLAEAMYDLACYLGYARDFPHEKP